MTLSTQEKEIHSKIDRGKCCSCHNNSLLLLGVFSGEERLLCWFLKARD
ncbi:unnamed protein product [Chondrus crispus]|uniref:Uncharacterized protein n=1 Tax=Chondrus crispus TaxID=2769 RepID=R7QKM2_CHOCR|nr:unnamed protein product [Chondrus crispus]CDF38629.1 unnamed protein product [Chondrus crispus]|eukprot:XP_005718534.1 unnamed protein product [Chondrus crispus]